MGSFLILITLFLVIIILLYGVFGKGHAFLKELEQALVLTVSITNIDDNNHNTPHLHE